jgi:hypothetical protein
MAGKAKQLYALVGSTLHYVYLPFFAMNGLRENYKIRFVRRLERTHNELNQFRLRIFFLRATKHNPFPVSCTKHSVRVTFKPRPSTKRSFLHFVEITRN